jgi:hypothetical protein
MQCNEINKRRYLNEKVSTIEISKAQDKIDLLTSHVTWGADILGLF